MFDIGSFFLANIRYPDIAQLLISDADISRYQYICHPSN